MYIHILVMLIIKIILIIKKNKKGWRRSSKILEKNMNKINLLRVLIECLIFFLKKIKIFRKKK